eukprot:scaffold518172_cov19-Prasinocladus_malaysianus.AAC.1
MHYASDSHDDALLHTGISSSCILSSAHSPSGLSADAMYIAWGASFESQKVHSRLYCNNLLTAILSRLVDYIRLSVGHFAIIMWHY